MMKLHFLLCLCSLISSVLGSVLAGPYQVVFFWYAYQLEVQANPTGNREIAPYCPAKTRSDKICTFDEFAKYIKKKTGTPKVWKGSSGVSATENWPEAKEAADGLVKNNYQSDIDSNKLMPSLNIDPGRPPKFHVTLKPLMESIQESRTILKAKGVDISDPIKKLTDANEAILAFRRQENAGKMPADFKIFMKQNSLDFKVEMKKVTNSFSSEVYEKIDTEKILANNPKLAADIKSKVKNFVSNYHEVEPGKGHKAAIDIFKQFLGVLGKKIC